MTATPLQLQLLLLLLLLPFAIVQTARSPL
jgi:hypothetical protein